MIKLKSANFTLKPNYYKLPVNQTNNIDEFNEVYYYWKEKEEKGEITFGIPRTPSGGICIQNKIFHPPYYDVKTDKNLGCELTVLAINDDDTPAFYRLQYRTTANKSRPCSGRKAFLAFCKELAKDNINIKDYYLTPEEGMKIKESIESPRIEVLMKSYKNTTFESAHHLDIRSSYPSGMAEFIPEWRPTIERLFKGRKIHQEYKDILNHTCGYFQSSRWFKAKLAHISKYAIHRNNEKIAKMLEFLQESGRMPLSINTDGIWFVGEPTNIHSNKLGDFNEDHTNCKLRIKSAGAYEFIEDGIYHPVIRGRTKLDKIKPREQWEWGDIYKTSAKTIMLGFDRDNGINEKESKEDEE